mgnify:FL=1|jgi:ATP-dependent Clp protease adaptor protein ClpS
MTAKETRRDPLRQPDDVAAGNKVLILYNDDVHTFDYVIDALVEICGHEYYQASQCATITHYKGKCDIKTGKFASLKVMKDALTERELTVTID